MPKKERPAMVGRKFCELLNDAIKDEENAPKMYTKLVASISEHGYLPVEATLAREVIIAIIHQEEDHGSLLRLIRAEQCPVKRE
jgi:rubrerythrin